MDAFTEAHLFVAAIRICQYKSGGTADIGDICKLLDYSVEHGHTVCRKLEKKGVVKTIEDPFAFKVSVKDYLAIETFSKEPEEDDKLAKEIEAFKAKKRDMDKEVAAIQAEIDRKKKDMFADIEAKLKQELNKKD